jgi:sugar phosphate isomerase/epimerase
MITTFAWFEYKLSKEKYFELIKYVGFDGVTLWWDDSFGDDDFRSNPALARNAGLFVENIHAPFSLTNNIWLDNHEGNCLVESHLKQIEDCAEYEIPAMVVHLSSGNEPPLFNERGLDRIKRIVEKAERNNIKIAFENLRKVEYLEYVLRHIPSPYAGFCYDSGHHHCWSPDVDLLTKYGDRLMAMHLHDNNGSGDQHRLPFDGTIDWASIMKQIKHTGYTGALALEAANIGYENLSSDEFFKLMYERAERLSFLFN